MTALAASLIAVILLVGIIGLHIALASGAPLGQFAWGGQETTLSPKRRGASVVSAIVLAAFVWVILIHGKVVEPVAPFAWTRAALWVFTTQFAFNTIANIASKSPQERVVMGAATAILTICCLLPALSE